MRGFAAITAGLITIVVSIASPVAADAASTGHSVAGPGGWVPAPTPPFDSAAGVNCDFAVHAAPVVDQVVTKVLQRYPDGTIHRDVFKGALVVRVTNTATGKFSDANASGSAVVEHAADGGQTWYVAGPILLGVRDGQGNIPRGLWVVDGVYRLAISSTGHRTLTLASGHLDNVCDQL